MPKYNEISEIRSGCSGRDGGRPVMGSRPGSCQRRTPCRSTCRAACAWDTRPCCVGTVVDASSSPRTCSHSRRSPGDRRPGGSVGKHTGQLAQALCSWSTRIFILHLEKISFLECFSFLFMYFFFDIFRNMV